MLLGQMGDGVDVNPWGGAILKAYSTWVIAGAFAVALASIAVITGLQGRAGSSRDAQLTLARVESEFSALQNIPYDQQTVDGRRAHAQVDAQLEAAEKGIESSLAELRANSPIPELLRVQSPYSENTASLERISELLVQEKFAEADQVDPTASRSEAVVNRHLEAAGVDYEERAASDGKLAGLGSAGAILVLVSLFAVFYLQSRRARETKRQAFTDDLTGLPNRRSFLQRLDKQLAEAQAADSAFGVLVIDLDGFKELNDTLGHHAGDEVLGQLGPRLAAAVRSRDLAARLSGDEFGVVLAGPCDQDLAVTTAAAILKAIARPFAVEGLSLQVAATVGSALYPVDATDPRSLLRRADLAMYEAKVDGPGPRDVAAGSRERIVLGGDLAAAIEAGELEVHFQPKADAADRHIVGLEALVRWRHPEHGMIPPDVFVPLAEQAGLSRALTRGVLSTALAQCKEWHAAGHDFHVAVNTTVADLLDLEFPGEVAKALSEHGLPADMLILEVTENSVMSDPTRIGNVLARLGELGVSVSLDDFGTGYSSLAHLKRLPVGEVKIDRSFVMGMADDDADTAIVVSTIQLAHALGMRVVAEGVEDEATWSRLAALGCEVVQGYVLSKPLPAAELEPVLRDRSPSLS
jgi:diguanylate cyclase (GGDEF)-like protein